ncbi:hypothetical protein DXG01_002465 [Tephrocybe rancida]|nr:hypothetical protein DXG01_002465 [Tephrocybe rancida]
MDPRSGRKSTSRGAPTPAYCAPIPQPIIPAPIPTPAMPAPPPIPTSTVPAPPLHAPTPAILGLPTCVLGDNEECGATGMGYPITCSYLCSAGPDTFDMPRGGFDTLCSPKLVRKLSFLPFTFGDALGAKGKDEEEAEAEEELPLRTA